MKLNMKFGRMRELPSNNYRNDGIAFNWACLTIWPKNNGTLSWDSHTSKLKETIAWQKPLTNFEVNQVFVRKSITLARYNNEIKT